MPIIKISLLPHSPLLIPEIGRANYDILNKTNSSYQYVIEELEKNNIETIIIITPHGLNISQSCVISNQKELKIDLKDFGFMPKDDTINSDPKLTKYIINKLQSNWKIKINPTENIDHGSAIPAYIINTINNNYKFIIISPANDLSTKEYINLGKDLGKILQNNKTNIAIIASADLSHRLKKKSPGDYSPKGFKFDNKIIEYLSKKEEIEDHISSLDPSLIQAAGECSLKPIATMVGCLSLFNWHSKFLAYQNDFGVGYLSMDFIYDK